VTAARWRCFVAAPLDDALRSALADSVARWSRQPPADALRWSEPGTWHLTLAFIGGVDSDDVPGIARTVGTVAAAGQPMRLPTGRLGAFPRSGSARVLWYAVGDPAGALGAVAADLARALGLTQDEPSRPHVTLARARRGHVDLRGWIEPASASAPEATLDVDHLELVRSHLGSGPARYETLATLALGGAP
jgi:RNA 2',3'-cyclic 3'-phosphodiesterase